MRLARKFAACLLVVATLLASTASARSLFRCRYDAIARDRCCCPPEEARAAATASLSRACCCERETIHVVKAPSTESHSVAPAFLAVAALVPYQPLATPRPRRVAWSARDGAAHGPPLLLRKQSFLI